VDIVVKGRKAEVTDRFRKHVMEKLSRIERYDGKAMSLDVELSRERNPRQADRCDRIEITMRTRGPVVRAEACAADPYAALDLATAKLEARLRRAADRRRIHHGRRSPVSVSVATATLAELEAEEISEQMRDRSAEQAAAKRVHHAGPIEVEGDGPMVVREKTHSAPAMDLCQALYEMELVGHDFYLFVDAETKLPSVVYRRKGYDYGVIHLEENGAAHYSGGQAGTEAEVPAPAGAHAA
jgi:ribosomal subunit interface protein